MAAKNKFYTVKKEINGVTYTAQFNGLSTALRAVDNSYIEGSGNTSSEKFAKYILENVIVDPKMDIDDFESTDELNEVVKFGREVMQGNFRDKKDKPADTGKSQG